MKTEYQGYTYFIKQKENETNIETSLRSWYIAKKIQKIKLVMIIVKKNHI